MIRAVLLDVDGTLVDSNDLHAQSWQAVLEDHGYATSFAQVRALIGMGGDKLVHALTGLPAHDPLAQRMVAERQARFLSDYAPHVRALPGARALVERILAAGQRLIVASSANHRELSALLARANLQRLLPDATSADDAAQSKPAPDIVQAALARLRVRASEAALIGDTPYDLKAALRAGVAFVGVRSGGYDDHALRGARAVYRDAQELADRYESSPLLSAEPVPRQL